MEKKASNYTTERKLVANYEWNRTHYKTYSGILSCFCAQSVIENSSGGTLLDLACGDGTITRLLSPHFDKIVGVDGSQKHLKLAQEKLPHAEFHASLIEEFEYNEQFDVTTLLLILEHVIDPVTLLQHVTKFLKPNGKMIIQVPNALACNRRIAKIMGTITSEYELSPFDINIAGHRRSYDKALLVKDITAAGLTVQSTGGIFYKMLSQSQMDWFLENGRWNNEFGWGRVGGEQKDWKFEFCRACYEYGKTQPDQCNLIYACVTK
ncbi:class I SAM-dependent methyltransferase [Candidatus Babeliales bacterium]|nr:class I SAM-dependent methyltransferase [Candidatus Babeliales bacterium]